MIPVIHDLRNWSWDTAMHCIVDPLDCTTEPAR